MMKNIKVISIGPADEKLEELDLK
jgi:hypothetical protein